jgi:DNA primase
MTYTQEQVSRTLESIGLSVADEVSDDFIVFCPYHNNNRTPAAEVSKERGTFYCFSCGQAATFEKLVMFVTQRTYFESVRLIESKSNEGNIVDEMTRTLAVVIEEPYDQKEIIRLHVNLLESDRAKAYAHSRGLTDGIDKFLLGYSKTADMITVPVHSPDGMTLGFVARSIEGKTFKNSSGMKKSKTLFNLHRVKTSPHVVVVESSFDAIRLDLVGIPAVATLGAGVSKHQVKLFEKYFNRIVIVPDAGQAGREMKDKLIKELGTKVTSVGLPIGVKDVGELSDDRLRKLAEFIDNPLGSLV